MNRNKILKILGFILGPVLVMVVAVYFLFPYINEEEYQEVADEYENSQPIAETSGTARIGRDFESLVEQVKVLKADKKQLQLMVDSLQTENKQLKGELEAAVAGQVEEGNKSSSTVQTAQISTKITPQNENEDQEKVLSEEAQSLLSLEDERLTPIVSEMSDQQLVQLYKNGGAIQRKKLLRSLTPKRAAQLIQKVML